MSEDIIELLKSILEKVKDRVATWNKVYQFKISDYGDFYVEFRGNTYSISKGTHSSPVATIIASKDDFIKILKGELDAFSAYFSGRLKVEGNVMEAASFANLLKEVKT